MFGIEDPSALLRPWKDLKQFSEELYAMFSRPNAAGGQASSDGAKRTISPGETPTMARSAVDLPGGINSVRETRIEQAKSRVVLPDSRGPSSHDYARRVSPFDSHQEQARRTESKEYVRSDASAPPEIKRAKSHDRTTEDGAARTVETPDVTRSKANDSTPRADDSRVREFASAEDVQPTSRPDPDLKYTTDIGDFANQVGGGGDSTVYVGKIVSGSGAMYKATLYPSGLTEDPGDTVDVLVPVIADGEQIPIGSTVMPIVQAGDLYYYQPPVWMD